MKSELLSRFFGRGQNEIGDNERRRFLEIIFGNNNNYDFSLELLKQGIDLNQIPSILKNIKVYDLIDAMANQYWKYLFQLAILYSLIPPNERLLQIAQKFDPIISDLKININSPPQYHYLCEDAERRLKISMKDGAVVLVDDTFLAKFRGKLALLCLNNVFCLPTNTILFRGVWYCLKDNRSKQIIREAFDLGDSKVGLNDFSLSILRPLSSYAAKTPEQLLKDIKKTVHNLPNKFPNMIGELTRKEYRINECDQYY